MRRYMKKCMGEREIAAVELADIGGDGVSTRPVIPATTREPTEEESSSRTAGKRNREVGDVELASFFELRSTCRRVADEAATESTLSPANVDVSCGTLTSVEETNCPSELPSCSSSNAFVEIDEDRFTIAEPTGQTESAQLETLTFSAGRERSTTSEPCAVAFGNLESTPLAEADSSHKQTTVAEMPSESEIEEFFSAAETDLQKRFSERYNFDIVNGLPLEGRYEWVPVKPAMR